MIAIKEAVSRSYDALKDMELVPEAADVELEEAELERLIKDSQGAEKRSGCEPTKEATR